MASTTKTQQVNHVYTLLKRRYKLAPRASERMSVLEAIIYGICHESSTREQANQALSRFKDQFFDWNEVRVSSVPEIQGVLAGLSEPASRAMTIRRFLRQLFEKTYGFNLETLHKKPLKDAVKALREFEAPRSDFVLATVIQKALGGHAIPLDSNMRRALTRLGIIDAETDDASVRSLLERAIPKNRGADFADLMEELCHDTCLPESPECARCELKKPCPAGQARLAARRGGAKTRGAKAAAKSAKTTRATQTRKPAVKAAKKAPRPAAKKAAPPSGAKSAKSKRAR